MVAGVLVVGGLALAVVGVLGWRRRLPRNRFAGVRTVNTLRDEEAFAVGNQVAAPTTMAAGAVAVLGAVVLLAAPHDPLAPPLALRITVVAVAGLGTLVLTVVGGVLGDRAARRVPVPALGGCSGVCSGCSAVCATSEAQPSEASDGAPRD